MGTKDHYHQKGHDELCQNMSLLVFHFVEGHMGVWKDFILLL